MDPVQSGSRSELEPLMTPPRISVIITTYDEDIYDDFATCVESVLAQTYDNFEVIIVTETEHARKRVVEEFADHDLIVHVHAEESLNLASARNLGAEHASGDVYAFIDDDALADEEWLESIANAYVEKDAIAVGGKLVPQWPEHEPMYLPPEFYWLVGVTHKGFREDAGPVRNTFGANITFRARVFDALDGFNAKFGKDHGHNLQGEETELCARIQNEYGEQLYYQPSAEVVHRVYRWQLQWSWLFNRAYWQGYTKRLMESQVSDSTSTEVGFLRVLLTKSVPYYLTEFMQLTSRKPIGRLVALLLLTTFVGIGYLSALANSTLKPS